MKIVKKTSTGGAWVRKKSYSFEGKDFEADIKDQDIITIKSAGESVVGEHGEQTVFKVETRNGEKNLSFNQTTKNNLVDSFGEESEDWVNKEVKVHTIRALISGKMQLVVYLAHKDANMEIDDNGNVTFEISGQKKEEEVNPEDIPF